MRSNIFPIESERFFFPKNIYIVVLCFKTSNYLTVVSLLSGIRVFTGSLKASGLARGHFIYQFVDWILKMSHFIR